MNTTPIILPNRIGNVSRNFNLGNANYDMDELYSPDTEYWKSKVLDLASPRDNPNKTYIFDKSRYNNHGTITGATWDRLPSGLPYLKFNGDDLVAINSVLTQLAATTNGSWETWAKLTDSTPGAINQLITFGDTDADVSIRLFVNTDGKIESYTPDNSDTRGWKFKTDSVLISDNKWFHVALNHNGTAPTLMVNGASAAITFSVSTDKTKWFSALAGIDNCRLACRNVYSLGNGLFLTGGMALTRLYSAVQANTVFTGHYNQERPLFGV
jgi:hypothetical protein